MNRNIKQIIKNLKKISSGKSNFITISILLKFIKDIKKRNNDLTKEEYSFIEKKLLILMSDMNKINKKYEMGILIESINLLLDAREIASISKNSKISAAFDDILDDEDLSKDGETDEEDFLNDLKSFDVKLIKKLSKKLKNKIFSQDNAIDVLVNAIKINTAGLGENNKPIGSFLFTGPTGVGKTELAKELASQLDIEFIRIDMSEYSKEHTSSKLIGPPAGYKGYENGGVLTNAIIKNSSAVLLLDEIEKADKDLMSIFLQIMDNAEITDGKGDKVCFRNVIVIMTSNLGTKSESSVGFANKGSKITNDVDSFFSPEFINRLDSVVKFKHLEKHVTLDIVNKFLNEISHTLTDKKVKLNVSDTAKDKLLELGYSKEKGARAIRRTITDFIKKPISEEILFGKIKNGGVVKVDMKIDEINFTYQTV